MKPCSKNRKPIAWLAIDALDAEKAAALRDHLAHCEGCRRYWEEISNVTVGLESAAPVSKLEASESFHRGVARKLRAVESSSFLEKLTTWLRGLVFTWRVALPVSAALVIALFVLVVPRHHPTVSLPMVQVVPASSSGSDLAPTVGNYQMVANQSLDKLDELLTKQGSKRLPPAPVFTAAELKHPNASL